MNAISLVKSILACICIIIALFVTVSILDIIIAVFYARFYSNLAFVITFGVGGIFAASFGYTIAITLAPVKNEKSRWTLIITMIIIGMLYFFLLARLEGGEYEAAFKAFGATLALGSLLFAKGKVD